MTLKTAYFKDADGDVIEVTTMHEIDAHSAVARFPWEWSFDADKFAKAPVVKVKGKAALVEPKVEDFKPGDDSKVSGF